MIKKIVLIIFFILIQSSYLLAADDFNIAIVDFKEFMDHSTIGKSIQKEIQSKREQLKSELEKMQADLKELEEKYKREAPLWTKEQKQENERAFRLRINDFNNLKIKNEKKFAEFRARKINEAKGDVLKYAEKIAEEEGYYLIIEKQTGTVLYAHSSINVTDEIIRDIDKDSKEQ